MEWQSTPLVVLTVDGVSFPLSVKPKTFSTGSRGYNFSGKVVVNGEKCQHTSNNVVIGSKPGSKTAPAQAATVKA